MEPTQAPVSKFKRGWAFTKSSWQVLKLDKELVALPLLSIISSMVALGLFVLAMFAYFTHGFTSFDTTTDSTSVPGWLQLLFLLVVGFVLTLIANIFSGAIVFGAIQRFTGGDPTVRGSVRAAMNKFRPLAAFSLVMATIGLALQLLEDRVPFAGKIAVWLLSASWNIANIFAVPVIVMSDHNVAPFDATKQSVAIIRKVWGEGAIAQFGISIIAVLSMFLYLLASAGLVFGALAVTSNPVLAVSVGAVAFIGALVLTLVFSALSSIMKAALYHYAMTGETPEAFNRELMRSAMTRQKARRVFA